MYSGLDHEITYMHVLFIFISSALSTINKLFSLMAKKKRKRQKEVEGGREEPS